MIVTRKRKISPRGVPVFGWRKFLLSFENLRYPFEFCLLGLLEANCIKFVLLDRETFLEFMSIVIVTSWRRHTCADLNVLRNRANEIRKRFEECYKVLLTRRHKQRLHTFFLYVVTSVIWQFGPQLELRRTKKNVPSMQPQLPQIHVPTSWCIPNHIRTDIQALYSTTHCFRLHVSVSAISNKIRVQCVSGVDVCLDVGRLLQSDGGCSLTNLVNFPLTILCSWLTGVNALEEEFPTSHKQTKFITTSL